MDGTLEFSSRSVHKPDPQRHAVQPIVSDQLLAGHLCGAIRTFRMQRRLLRHRFQGHVPVNRAGTHIDKTFHAIVARRFQSSQRSNHVGAVYLVRVVQKQLWMGDRRVVQDPVHFVGVQNLVDRPVLRHVALHIGTALHLTGRLMSAEADHFLPHAAQMGHQPRSHQTVSADD